MTKFTYQATSLRSFIKQMLPSAESKNITESNYTTLYLREEEQQFADGSRQQQFVLHAETDQPTFDMHLSMVLSTDEAQADDTILRLHTRDVDTILGSFGQQMVTVYFFPDGMMAVESTQVSEEDGKPLKRIVMRCETDFAEEWPVIENPTCTLTSMTPLLDGLRSVVSIASKRGNSIHCQGVNVILEPERLTVSSSCPGVNANMQYEAPWAKPPQRMQTMMISTDCARHMIAALSAYGTNDPVTLDYTVGLLEFETTNIRFAVDAC